MRLPRTSPAHSSAATAHCRNTMADVRDLVVIGAGPHALALLTRLLEESPDPSGDFWIGLTSRPIGDKAARDMVFDAAGGADEADDAARAGAAPSDARVRGCRHFLFRKNWSLTGDALPN